MNSLKIDLTEEQLEILEPLFEAVRTNNENGTESAIAAQVWEDGMVVKLMTGEKARALSAALGGKFEHYAYSAADRMDMQ